MKLYATIQNSKGKREGLGDNEYLDIDIRVGNESLQRLTVRHEDFFEVGSSEVGAFVLYDERDNPISYVEDIKQAKKTNIHCRAQVGEDYCGKLAKK